jgi:hypothetical protein
MNDRHYMEEKRRRALTVVSQDRPRFFVLACSRSATVYVAKLFWKIGIPCAHEKFFDIWRVMGPNPPSAFARTFPYRRGEASFLAVPYVDELPPGSIVLHQVRHPVAVTRSHMGIRFFAERFQPSVNLAENHPDITGFIRRHCPEVFADEDELERSLRYWVYWNRVAQRAEQRTDLRYMRYRVEDLDCSLLRCIVSMLGDEIPDEILDHGLSRISKRANHRPRDESIYWDAIPPSDAKDAVAALAAEYGYDVRREDAVGHNADPIGWNDERA